MIGQNIKKSNFPNDELKRTRYLLCIDYDDTLVCGGFYKELENMGVLPGEANQEHLNHLIETMGLKNPDEMRDIIREALNTHNFIAIVSFTSYVEIVQDTLLSIGLVDTEIAQIYIKGHFPKNGDWTEIGKSEHINAAKAHFKLGDDDHIILVDDNPINISLARSQGCHVVLVPPGAAKEPVTFNSNLKKEVPSYIHDIHVKIEKLSQLTNRQPPAISLAQSKAMLSLYQLRTTLRESPLDVIEIGGYQLRNSVRNKARPYF